LVRNGIALLALGVGLLALAFTWQPAIDPSKIDWPIAAVVAAAIVQAATAVVIVLLTRRLARTADTALTATRRQVEVASDASLRARRDAHVASVPRLTVSRPSRYEGESRIRIDIANDDVADPALDVRVSLYASELSAMPSETIREPCKRSAASHRVETPGPTWTYTYSGTCPVH
jgi:hypothetical protein